MYNNKLIVTINLLCAKDSFDMRKTALLLLFFLSLTFLLPSCTQSKEDEDTIHVVTTIFPLYDWTREILGDVEGFSLTLLLDSGTDVHSYQPSAKDLIDIQNADLFLYVGGESDEWVEEVLTQSEIETNTLALLPLLEGYREELTPGMQGHADGAIDEHIWLSLVNAALSMEEITKALIDLAPEAAETLTKNKNDYLLRLAELSDGYQVMMDHAACHTILVADRFPFRYLAEEWNITYYAAFPGCSAETEASFETVASLADTLAREGLPVILTTESSDGELAKTIMQTAGTEVTVMALDSMQSVTSQKIADGYTYLSVMDANLAILQKALGSN